MPARIAEVPLATPMRPPQRTPALVAVAVFLIGAAVVIGEHAARAAVADEFTERAAPLLHGGELSAETVEVTGGSAVALLLSPRWTGSIHGTDRSGLPVSIEIDGLARDASTADSAAWVVRENVSSELRGVPDTAYAELVRAGGDIRVQLAARTEGADAVVEMYGIWLDGRSVPLHEVDPDIRDAVPAARVVLPAPTAATLVEDVRFASNDTLNMRLVAYDVPLD